MVDLNLQLFRQQRADTIRPGQLIVDEHGVDLLVDEVALRCDQVVLLGRRPTATSTRRLAIRCSLADEIQVMPSSYDDAVEALGQLILLDGVPLHGQRSIGLGKGWLLGFTLPLANGGLITSVDGLTIVGEPGPERFGTAD